MPTLGQLGLASQIHQDGGRTARTNQRTVSKQRHLFASSPATFSSNLLLNSSSVKSTSQRGVDVVLSALATMSTMDFDRAPSRLQSVFLVESAQQLIGVPTSGKATVPVDRTASVFPAPCAGQTPANFELSQPPFPELARKGNLFTDVAHPVKTSLPMSHEE